jgi:hypothetical protein
MITVSVFWVDEAAPLPDVYDGKRLPPPPLSLKLALPKMRVRIPPESLEYARSVEILS